MHTNADPRWALAIDLGGTKVECALVAEDGTLRKDTRARRPTGRDASSDELVLAVTGAVQESLAAGGDVNIAGVGVASAGPVSRETGEVSPLNLPAWRGFPLAGLVRELTGIDPVLRLDGFSIALAESWLGALRGAGTGMALVVSTGIGGGILLDGRLAGGRSGNAGHIGQMQVVDPDRQDGSFVTLESVASGPSAVGWARAHGWSGTTGEELSAAFSRRDSVAVAAVDRCARALGDAIASASALLEPEVVAIGGGFANVAADLVERVQRRYQDVIPLETLRDVRIVPSVLGVDGPLQGAAGLVHRPDLLPG